MRRKVAYLHGNLPIPISHNVFLVCVFNVRLKVRIRIRTGAVL